MCCSASINKLLASIRHILEVFPESVIIRAKSNNEESSIEFANQSAVSTFDISECSDNSRFRNTQRFAVLEQSDQNLNELTMDMDDVLDYLERKHVDINNEDVQLQMVDKQMNDDESNFEGSKFFTVKTIEVEWEQHQHALMHVFVNVSSVKKLEKVKATNKWLHIMFSSISHEFRTPLNAFMNALTLIKINFEAVEAALDDKTAALTSVVKSRDSLHRNITTASVSSKVRKFVADCVVASLTEDILDFAKIEAGMFALNEKPLEVLACRRGRVHLREPVQTERPLAQDPLPGRADAHAVRLWRTAFGRCYEPETRTSSRTAAAWLKIHWKPVTLNLMFNFNN